MLGGTFKAWQILTWLGGLIVIVFIDAARELQRRRAPGGGFTPELVRAVARGRKAAAMQELFDRSADEDLYPEVKPPTAWWRETAAAEQLLDKSA